MEVSLSLLLQQIVSAENIEDYEDQRDALIDELEAKGFSVSIDSESSEDLDDDFDDDIIWEDVDDDDDWSSVSR